MKTYACMIVALLAGCTKDDGKKADDKGSSAPGGAASAPEAHKKRHGARTEAALMLRNIEKRLKVSYIENATFPKGQSKTLPAASCCGGPGGKCAVVPADEWAKDPAWAALEFHVDEPNSFHYTYASDGQTVHVTAVGDLDCDTKMITYVLDGKVDGGNPSFTLTEPPPNAD